MNSRTEQTTVAQETARAGATCRTHRSNSHCGGCGNAVEKQELLLNRHAIALVAATAYKASMGAPRQHKSGPNGR